MGSDVIFTQAVTSGEYGRNDHVNPTPANMAERLITSSVTIANCSYITIIISITPVVGPFHS